MPRFTLTVNGKKQSVKADADTPLLWVIRDNLNLPGTKYACGRGLCGTCTVHLDGEPARSCMTTVEYAEDREITTIEGLSQNGLHPVQKAWIAEDVPQCGYCQSGQIMTAAALLNENPSPSDRDIDVAMKMTLCRCGTYQRIRKAIHRAAKEIRRG